MNEPLAWLKEIRLLKSKTGKEVGAACGISESHYLMIENGQRGNPLKVDIAKGIADYLDFNWTRFYDDVEARKTS